MTRQLDRNRLAEVLQNQDIEALAFPKLVQLFRAETAPAGYLPDGVYQVDPRTGDVIVYHSSRARRPHDNRPAEPSGPAGEPACVICQGRTTGVLDLAELSQGFTFINKNLFPVVYPFDQEGRGPAAGANLEPEMQPAYGLHFVQWTSSLHDKDWHNMPLGDCQVVMQRLAALEKKLVSEAGDFMPLHKAGARGFVLIVKNFGHLVGASLSHDHQQIVFSSVMPRRLQDNWRFQVERGEVFGAYLLRENPRHLVVKDYGPAVLLVPYFMRRPFDMLLVLKDPHKQYLHHMSQAELAAVAAGWQDAIRAIRRVMPEIGREVAYNVITSNGPGAGIYFEFLPYTQEIGGAEHLGLFICQHEPKSAAARLRALVSG